MDNIFNPEINNCVVLRVKFCTKSVDLFGYTNYVFENLDTTRWDNKYIMCVRYPNWSGYAPENFEIGFLQFTYIKAGSKYYNKDNEKEEVYKYDHIRYDKFLPLEEKKKDIIMD